MNKIAIKGTTQEHLLIEDITDDLVILKDGSAIMILETASVNFDLLSEREQDAMIYAYAALLNSLTFQVQIVIRSALKDVSVYVDRLKQQEARTIDPLMRNQIGGYRRFVEEVVKKNNVLAKSFYIIVPFFSVELGLATAAKGTFPLPIPWIGKSANSGLPMEKTEIVKKAKGILEPKKEHIGRLFGRLGLSLRQLNSGELIKLFYQIYNQESALVGNEEALSQQGAIVRGKVS